MYSRVLIAGMRLFGHTLRVVYSPTDGTSFRPELHLFLSGPNGSPAGFGPKGWPRAFRPLFPRYGGRPAHRWSDMLVVPFPRMRWATGYKLRRIGGLHAYRALYRLYRPLARKPL